MKKNVIIATKNGKTVEQPVATPELRQKWLDAFKANGWKVKEAKVAA